MLACGDKRGQRPMALSDDVLDMRFPSRYIQHELESATDAEKAAIFAEVLPQTIDLMTDVFGNYVVQKYVHVLAVPVDLSGHVCLFCFVTSRFTRLFILTHTHLPFIFLSGFMHQGFCPRHA